MPADLLQLDSETVSACIKRYGTYTVEQLAPHKLNIKSGSTTILDAQTSQGKKWTVQVIINIIEEDA